MKTIKSLLEQYDPASKTKDDGMRQLYQLAQMGLLEETKLPLIERALNKTPDEMNIAEKRILVSLLESLTAHILSEASSSVKKYSSRIVPNASNPPEAPFKDRLATYDRRQNSDKNIPIIILLKRKALRVFPDNQKIGLYYSQALDKYVSIPFGPNEPITYPMNEEPLNEKTKWKLVSRANKLATAKAFRDKPQKETDAEARYLSPALQQKSKEYAERDRKHYINKNLLSKAPNKDLPDIPGGFRELMARQNTGDELQNTIQRLGLGSAYLARKALRSLKAKKAEPEVKTKPEAKGSGPPVKPDIDIPQDLKDTHAEKQKIRDYLSQEKSKKAKETMATYSQERKAEREAKAAAHNVRGKIKRSVPPPPVLAGPVPVRESFRKKIGVLKERSLAPLESIPKAEPETEAAKPAEKSTKQGVLRKYVLRTRKHRLGVKFKKPGDVKKAARAVAVATGAGALAYGVQAFTGDPVEGGNNHKSNNKAAAQSVSVPSSRGGKGVITQTKRQTYDASEVQQQAQANRKLWPNIRENNFRIIKNMVENNIPKEELTFGDSSILINSRLAKKIIKVYESLNRHNRQKVEKMLNENIGSFKKVISFSVKA
jgi:hypothetical protein